MVATKIYIHQKKQKYIRDMRTLRVALIAVQFLLLAVSIVLIVLLLYLPTVNEVTSSEQVTEIQFYFIASLFSLILMAYFVVDIKLIQRLKQFYAAFYSR